EPQEAKWRAGSGAAGGSGTPPDLRPSAVLPVVLVPTAKHVTSQQLMVTLATSSNRLRVLLAALRPPPLFPPQRLARLAPRLERGVAMVECEVAEALRRHQMLTDVGVMGGPVPLAPHEAPIRDRLRPHQDAIVLRPEDDGKGGLLPGFLRVGVNRANMHHFVATHDDRAIPSLGFGDASHVCATTLRIVHRVRPLDFRGHLAVRRKTV